MEKPLTTIIEESIDLRLYLRELDNLIEHTRDLHKEIFNIIDVNPSTIDKDTKDYIFMKDGIEPLRNFIDKMERERDKVYKVYRTLSDLRNKKMN